MRISYAITVCTEFLEIQRLINFLLKHKRAQDDIVVLFDEANGDKEIEAYLRSHSVNGEFSWYAGKFERHFADWKNKLTSYCTGDYIFQIDADETPDEELSDWKNAVQTLMILCSEVEAKAKQQGHTEMVDVDDVTPTTTEAPPANL